MSKKKKKRGIVGTPYVKGVINGNTGAPPVSDACPGSLKRYDGELVHKACVNESVKHCSRLPGVKLRPKTSLPDETTTTDSSNDIVDMTLLNESHYNALRAHQNYIFESRRPAISHTVRFRMEKVGNKGFGTSVRYHCSGCRFTSANYKLYHTTLTGACVTNLQAGIALSKVSIKASDAFFMFSSLNLTGPAPSTLQRHFTQSCAVAGDVLEDSLADNRAVVRDYLGIVGRVDDPDCPSASVSLDGQFNRPVYHSYDGKSTSVSEPVIENETDMNLLISHSVISKLDGSYPQDKVR